MLFKKNKKIVPERSKYVEAPRVFISLERPIPLAPYQNYKIGGGVSLGVGDVLTIMKQGAVSVQENETVADAFARAFQATNEAIDAQACKEGLKEIMDRSFGMMKADNERNAMMKADSDRLANKPISPPVIAAAKTTDLAPAKSPDKPASQKAVATVQPVQPKKTSVTERLAAETDKLKSRSSDKQ